jgi:two-component system chemotaxis response regulator CheB
MTSQPIRILVVDDSAIVRGFWARVLDAQPDMRVVASAGNGRAAVDVANRRPVDVVVLDVEMPEMDGLEALPLLLAAHPGLHVVMASSLTRSGAKTTITALSLGAADYVAKPSASDAGSLDRVGAELVRKVRAIAGRGEAEPLPAPPRATVGAPHAGQAASDGGRLGARQGARQGACAPRVIGITSSTGGPSALTTLLSALPAAYPLPILVVQHMPALFTTMLAERLERMTQRPCIEGAPGMEILPGHTYVAPGDHHMVVEARGERVVLALNQDDPVNFCRPSADPLFRSMARVYRGAMTCVVLTGMGHDGLDGARAVAEQGGLVVVQDEATSVVWGMPGAIARAGLASRVLPLEGIAPLLDEHVRVRR